MKYFAQDVTGKQIVDDIVTSFVHCHITLFGHASIYGYALTLCEYRVCFDIMSHTVEYLWPPLVAESTSAALMYAQGLSQPQSGGQSRFLLLTAWYPASPTITEVLTLPSGTIKRYSCAHSSLRAQINPDIHVSHSAERSRASTASLLPPKALNSS